MPPEPLPWDRKEHLFKDHRKHERGDALGGSGGASSSNPRWRDPYHGSRDLLPRASPRRPLSGHYRQGGGYNQVQPEDSVGHGCMPSRSERLWSEDEGFRSSSARYGGGHRGNGRGTSREIRGYFRRSPRWDPSDVWRQHDHDSHVTPQRSVATPISSACQIPLKDPNGKTGSGVDDGLDTGHVFEYRGHSLGSIPWKKWSRPASVAFTRSGRSDSQEVDIDTLPSGKENPIRSPVTSSLPLEELAPKKKPRLGWGQGLAKYEKQKVEGPVDFSLCDSKGLLGDCSQRNTCTSGCLSPATPCSATCSSSPGTEDKSCSKVINDDNGTSQIIAVPGTTFLHSNEEVPINLDQLEVNPISALDSLLADMFQSEDAFCGESNLTRHSAMCKLSTWKDFISNGLEKIESEIDLFEKELKSMYCDPKDGACQKSTKLEDVSVSESCLKPLADVSSESNTTENQKVLELNVAIVENAPCRRIAEEDALVEGINIANIHTVSSRISKTPDLTREILDMKWERKSLLPEVEDLEEISESPQVANNDSGERVMVASEDDHKDCIDASSINVHVIPDGNKRSEMRSNLMTLIMDSNVNAAKSASKMFDEVLPRSMPQLGIWGLVDFKSCRKNNLKIKEKLAARKSQLKFKEQVLTLKFRLLHFLWEEDLRALSIRKLRSKSGKRVELRRSLQVNSLKQRSSSPCLLSLPGNLTLVPTREIVNLTSKLLLDSQIKFYRNDLMMPALLLDDKERKSTKFVTQNGLIEDPPRLEKEREMINPWSHDEKEIFMEMLAQVGKDFTKISSVLSHKTTADCIEFYYKNHKSDSFKEVKKRLVLRKQQQCLPASIYLVGSGKVRSHELNASSLDILGAASFVAAHGHGTASSQKYVGKAVNGAYNIAKQTYRSCGHSERASADDISMQVRESAAADTLLGIGGALSSEAMSSCITSSADPSDKMNYAKMEQMLTSEMSGNQDEDACSDGGYGELDSSDWTDEEKSLFIKALGIYGKDFNKISMCIKTRSREQCKIFFSKARKCLGLDAIQDSTDNGGNMPMNNANGGRSDIDDACVAEMDSAICSTLSCSQVDLDVSQPVANTSYDENFHTASMHSNVERNVSDEQNEGTYIGTILEGTEENTDNKQVCSFPAVKFPCQGDNLQSDVPTKESIAADVDYTDRVITDSVNRETGVTRISNVVSANELAVKASTKTELKLSSSTVILNAETDGGSTKEVDIKPSLLTKVCLSDEKLVNINSRASGENSRCSEIDFNACGPSRLSENKADARHHTSAVPSYQQQLRLDLLSRLSRKHQSILLKKAESRSVSLNSFYADPSSISFSGSLKESSCTTLNFEDHSNKKHHAIVKGDLYQQYMLRNLPVNQVNYNFQVLGGYPLQAFHQEVKKEVEVPSYETTSLLETDSQNWRAPQSNDLSMWDTKWKKSSIPIFSHSRSDIPCTSGVRNRSEAELKSFVNNACSETEECKTGDVKLFGKILSRPLPLQKSSTSSHENNVGHQFPKTEVSSTMNFTSNGNIQNQYIEKAGTSGQASLEEQQPVRGYGFWDMERIQAGLSSLPETAAVPAKFQEPLSGGYLTSKDGISIPSFPTTMTEYHQSYMPQLSSDGNWLNSFSELQKRKGAEITVSGLQQQGRVTPPVGGGVTDPVAALKLHYAAAARAKVQGLVNKGVIESWRSDLGFR